MCNWSNILEELILTTPHTLQQFNPSKTYLVESVDTYIDLADVK